MISGVWLLTRGLRLHTVQNELPSSSLPVVAVEVFDFFVGFVDCLATVSSAESSAASRRDRLRFLAPPLEPTISVCLVL